MTKKLAYSVHEVSETIGIGRTKIYELINQGTFRPIKVGRRTLIPADQISALFHDQQRR